MYLTNRNRSINGAPALWYKLVSHRSRGGHPDHAITHTYPLFTFTVTPSLRFCILTAFTNPQNDIFYPFTHFITN